MERLRRGLRSTYANQLRAKAVQIVESIGNWTSAIVAENTVPTLGAEAGTLSILYTTPFQKFDRRSYTVPPSANEIEKYGQAVLHAKSFTRPVSYILDIWHENQKVFSIAWDQLESLEIVTFKRGAWEHELLNFNPLGQTEGDRNSPPQKAASGMVRYTKASSHIAGGRFDAAERNAVIGPISGIL